MPAPRSAQSSWLVFAGVVACFFLSGLAALLYQTAWLRQFSLVFGTSELAVATVLAAYMGGLAMGSALAGRFAHRVTHPVLVYGLLEAGIALSALTVPLLLLAARALYASVLGDQPTPPDAATIGQPVFYLLVAFVVLVIPTGLMGATLPLLTRYAVRTDREVGPRVALLYATNTAGAVCGTLAAAFVLLPALGLAATVWVGVAINGLVFAIAAYLARLGRDTATGEIAIPASAPPGFIESCVMPLLRGKAAPRERLSMALITQPGWTLPLMLVSGATAFLYEVLWTRMLTHVMGGSIYAFATMLAAFLTGIALGGGLAGKVAEDRERAAVGFALTQAAIGVLSIGVYAWMGPLIPDALTTFALVIFAVVVMLPATIFIGATLPLAVRILARDENQAAAGAARIYAWNTVGAIVGAILAGFVLIPQLGFEGSIRVAVATNFCLALWAATCVARPRPLPVGLAGMGIAAVLLIYDPGRPQAVVSSTGFFSHRLTEPEEIYYDVGRSSTVMLLGEGSYYYLRTNGLPEASIAARGAPAMQDPEKWLTALAVAARPATEDMLVIGFGGGVALEGVPPSVDRIDVVELEPKVVEANRQLADRRNIDPLADPRFNIIINDARNALRLTRKNYDAIVSQPSHPWTAGASHLFTREFVVDAKSHLNEGGIFVQWMNSEFVDEPLLRTLAATLVAEFQHVRLYHPASQVLTFLASDAPLDLELQLARTGRPLIDDVMHFSRLGLNGVEDLVVAMAMDEVGVESFARRADISTDDNNLMAMRSRSRIDGLRLSDLIELFESYDPLLKADSWVHARLGEELDYGYITRRLLRMAQLPRATSMATVIPNFSRQFEVYALLFQATGQMTQAREALNEALRANPLNMQARYLLARDYLGALSRSEAPEAIQVIADGLAGAATAVVEGWNYSATADWASLAALDTQLGRAQVTDAWYPDAARLRAEWRVNMAEDQQHFALDALRFIEPVLILAPDQNLFRLRATSARILGDDHRLLESSRYIAGYVRASLNASANQGDSISASQLGRMRQTLAAISDQLSGDLDIVDRQRVTAVVNSVNELIRYIDDYPRPR